MKYDIVVTDQFNSDCSLALAYKLRAPVVEMTSRVLGGRHGSTEYFTTLHTCPSSS